MVQPWCVCQENGTQHFLVYIIRLKRLESKTIVICLILRPNCIFEVCFSVLDTFSHKVVQIGLFDIKNGTHHYLVYIIVLKWLESKTIIICLILRAKLRFWGFFSVLGNLWHNVVQTLFVCQEKWYTSLFGIYIIFLEWLE